MARIVLASGSPRRQELLTRIGIRDAVPPPEPNLCPMGSDVQNHSFRSARSISWKHATKFGGSDNNFFISYTLLYISVPDD